MDLDWDSAGLRLAATQELLEGDPELWRGGRRHGQCLRDLAIPERRAGVGSRSRGSKLRPDNGSKNYAPFGCEIALVGADLPAVTLGMPLKEHEVRKRPCIAQPCSDPGPDRRALRRQLRTLWLLPDALPFEVELPGGRRRGRFDRGVRRRRAAGRRLLTSRRKQRTLRVWADGSIGGKPLLLLKAADSAPRRRIGDSVLGQLQSKDVVQGALHPAHVF